MIQGLASPVAKQAGYKSTKIKKTKNPVGPYHTAETEITRSISGDKDIFW